jgi:hypothetical protein
MLYQTPQSSQYHPILNTCTKQSSAHFSFHHAPHGVPTLLLLFITTLVMVVARDTSQELCGGSVVSYRLTFYHILLFIFWINYLVVVVIISIIPSLINDPRWTAFQICEESKCARAAPSSFMLQETVSG